MNVADLAAAIPAELTDPARLSSRQRAGHFDNLVRALDSYVGDNTDDGMIDFEIIHAKERTCAGRLILSTAARTSVFSVELSGKLLRMTDPEAVKLPPTYLGRSGAVISSVAGIVADFFSSHAAGKGN